MDFTFHLKNKSDLFNIRYEKIENDFIQSNDEDIVDYDKRNRESYDPAR